MPFAVHGSPFAAGKYDEDFVKLAAARDRSPRRPLWTNAGETLEGARSVGAAKYDEHFVIRCCD